MKPEKKCSRGCGETKPLSEFHRSTRERDGHVTQCKECRAEERRQNLERYTEYSRRSKCKRRSRVGEETRQYAQRHPEKWKARKVMRDATRTGRLTKPGRCENCDALTEPIHLHGHHEDYSKPLEVEWLCRPCHVERHKESDDA